MPKYIFHIFRKFLPGLTQRQLEQLAAWIRNTNPEQVCEAIIFQIEKEIEECKETR